MKKYIAPTAKYINIASEGSLLTQSYPDRSLEVGTGTVDGNNIDSNRRNSIWGED